MIRVAIADLTPGQLSLAVARIEGWPVVVESVEEQWQAFTREVNVTRFSQDMRDAIRGALRPRLAIRVDSYTLSQDAPKLVPGGSPNVVESWAACGPIIDREGIGLEYYEGGVWYAAESDSHGAHRHPGRGPLVAAMRAHVAMSLANDPGRVSVDLPLEAKDLP
jgi:hypothetical protein